MLATPTTSLSKLNALRGREKLFYVAWGVSRWLALVLTCLTMAMIADWWIDKNRDTPQWVRIPLSLLQIVGFAVAGYFLLVRPWTKGPSLIPLAKRVEENIEEFDHRLITSIQLTRHSARTEGMSAELIGIITDEAEQIAGEHNLMALADKRRLHWSLALILWPVVLIGFLLLFFKPTLLGILLERQMFGSTEIPRHIHLNNKTPKLWPTGEMVTVHYEVESKDARIPDELKGTVRVSFEGQPDSYAPLVMVQRIDDRKAIFAAHVSSDKGSPFRYRAWLGDGRTKHADEVTFEPRPQVDVFGAWMLLPEYVPLRPDGLPYMVEQRYGDLRLYHQATALVRVYVQKPCPTVKLQLLDRKYDDESATVLREIDMEEVAVEELRDGTKRYHYSQTVSMDLPGNATPNRYRVVAVDKNGFESKRNPHKSIELINPELPYVELLPDRFAEAGMATTEEEIQVLKDLPIPLRDDAKLLIEYTCRSPIGFPDPVRGTQGVLNAPARLMVRVNEELTPRIYVLEEIPETVESGEYDLLRASFAKPAVMAKLVKDFNGVPFHGKPSSDPLTIIPRTTGGGVYHLPIKELKKVGLDGTPKSLEVGDSIEFWIEVKDRSGQWATQASSQRRRKEIRSELELIQQAQGQLQTDTKLQTINQRQIETFQPKKK